ncbi:LMBR1 domain-containing protein 2 [Allomyces arbusculus]|nr:LMBR1 domain-containing protein 2 [Allomyces arbusculus]
MSSAPAIPSPYIPPDDASLGGEAIIVGWIVIAFVSAGLLRSLLDRCDAAWYSMLAVFIGWTGPFSILYFLPLDLSSTKYRACLAQQAAGAVDLPCTPPLLYIAYATQLSIWQAIYWTLFFLTWFTIPILQSATDSGGFTAAQSFRKAIRYNAWYYSVLGIVGAVLLTVLAVWRGLDFASLKGFLMAISNAYGLLLVVLFMSYGLVDIPRELWHAADVRRSLSMLEYRAPRYKEQLESSMRDLQEVQKSILALDPLVPVSNPVRKYVDRMLIQCPAELRNTPAPSGGFTSWFRSGPAAPSPDQITLKSLQQLHRSLKQAILARNRCQYQWDHLIERAHFFQDIIDNSDNSDRRFHVLGRFRASWRQRLEWVWYVHGRGTLLRLFALIAGVLSIALLWSEVTMNMGLSVFELVQRAKSYAATELVALVTLAYLAACTFGPLLSIRVFSIYQLAPGQHTNVKSLLFFAAYMTRLCFPLSWNMLNLTQSEAVFSRVMGSVNLVPLLGDSFNDWVPISLVVLCGITVLNIQARILRMCGLDAAYVAGDGDDADDEARRADGRMLLTQAKAAREAARVAGAATPLVSGQTNEPLLLAAADAPAESNVVTQPPQYAALALDDEFVPLGRRRAGRNGNSRTSTPALPPLPPLPAQQPQQQTASRAAAALAPPPPPPPPPSVPAARPAPQVVSPPNPTTGLSIPKSISFTFAMGGRAPTLARGNVNSGAQPQQQSAAGVGLAVPTANGRKRSVSTTGPAAPNVSSPPVGKGAAAPPSVKRPLNLFDDI